MNYLLNLWRLPILSVLLSSLLIGSLPAQATTQAISAKSAHRDSAPLSPYELTASSSIATISSDSLNKKSEVLLAQSTKISPQLEQQVIEVLRKHPEVLLEVLQKYTIEQEQKQQKLQVQAINQARKNTKALIGDSPTKGAINRKIVMVEFSDFQCPFCATATKNVQEFMAKHKDQVTLVYKHFPLTQIHAEALPAAGAAWAANKQGKFWEYHDVLFANQSRLGEILYLETANSLKLDLRKFNADRKIANEFIVQDYQLGRKLGVDATPTFIMNGEVITGAATLADLEKALAKVSQK